MTINVENHGSIVLLRPVGKKAKTWLKKNVDENALTWGGATVVEPRYVGPILDGFREEGGRVRG